MENLENWYIQYEIFDVTLENLWESFYEYKREHNEKFMYTFPLERDNVNLRFVKIAHEVALPDFKDEYICVYVDIYTDNECVGWFKQLLNLDGTTKDRYFVIEERGE